MKTNGLIYAYLMDGQGGTEKLDWENVPKWQDEHEPIWLHFDYHFRRRICLDDRRAKPCR
ncbi:MAG: hypothetical protein ACYS3N_23840 [Planctomycetota bacterium]